MIKLWIAGLLVFAFSFSAEKKEKQATRIHQKALTIDTHVDTPLALLRQGFDIGKRNAPPRSRVDLVRMEEGGLDAVFFAAFTGQQERTPENTEEAYRRAHEMIDATYEVCNAYSDRAELALQSGDAARIEAAGKRAIYIGMENGFPLGEDIRRVKEFYDRGVRYITLCHSSNNAICDSSTDPDGPEHNGLSPFGEKVVKEMNKLGLMIDVSHISDKAFFDVLEMTKTPVIASHSSVRAIAGHPRNMTDEMIKALAKNGGVIQICFLDDYVKDPDTTTVRYRKMQELRKVYNESFEEMSDEEQTAFHEKWRETAEKYPKKLPTVAHLVDHIDHVNNLVGIDYVGIGSDFDGGGGLADCEDVSQFPAVTQEMINRGYTEEEILKVWGGNFMRVFREVEEMGDKLTN